MTVTPVLRKTYGHRPPLCVECGLPATFSATSDHVYSRNYGAIWECRCGAFVGCHEGGSGSRPKGRPGGPVTRELRKSAHNLWFDPLWKRRNWSRETGYAFLTEALNAQRNVHIAEMGPSELHAVKAACLDELGADLWHLAMETAGHLTLKKDVWSLSGAARAEILLGKQLGVLGPRSERIICVAFDPPVHPGRRASSKHLARETSRKGVRTSQGTKVKSADAESPSRSVDARDWSSSDLHRLEQLWKAEDSTLEGVASRLKRPMRACALRLVALGLLTPDVAQTRQDYESLDALLRKYCSDLYEDR